MKSDDFTKDKRTKIMDEKMKREVEAVTTDNEYICDDREKVVPEYIKKMTEEELREAYRKAFGKYPAD